MEIAQLTDALRHDALTVVFINVLLQQLGLPVPAVPTLLLAGSLAAGPGNLASGLTAAVIASLIADGVWYAAGRSFGYRVLSGLCRLSINPSSCVNQTEARFIRWGLSSLVVAKFIPGFSTVAPPIAGALRMNLPGFILASGLGASLWAGLATAAGWLLQDAVLGTIAALEQHASSAILIALALFGGWLAWKLHERRRFRRRSEIPFATPAELLAARQTANSPVLVDLRSATLIAETGPLPGARIASHDNLLEVLADLPPEHPIVTLCACPEDAGAIHAARNLQAAGFLQVRPLRGGYAAWQSLHAAATRKQASG